MLITGNTFNGANIIALPCDTMHRVSQPSSIEWDPHEVVAQSASEFSGQVQIYDWMQSWWEGQVSFPPMSRLSHDAWAAFIKVCRGPMNVFFLSDPKARKPKGLAPGNPTPLVNGAGQSGYSLATHAWMPSVKAIFLPHDYVQIGNRLYAVTDTVDSDVNGHATLPIWPPLRDLPADGTEIITRNAKGLFRLKNSTGNKDSVNVGSYGLSGFAIKEAI